LGSSGLVSRLFGAAAAVACVLAAAAPASGHEPQTPTGAASTPLAIPPADAETWTIFSATARFGQARRWTTADGVRWSRDTMSERGYVQDQDQQIGFAPDGTMAFLSVRGVSSGGDAAETFRRDGRRYTFRSPVDRGQGEADASALYLPFGGTLDATFVLVEALAGAPGQAAPLLPSGHAALEPLTTLRVTVNGETRTLDARLITGLDLSPLPVWMDGQKPFGIVGPFSYLPKGWEAAAPQMIAAETAALAERAPRLLARIAKRPPRAIAFVHVRLYDADALTFREDMTVVAAGGRIAAAGPAATTAVPDGAQLVDGRGKTLVPGLWDSHKHYGDDSTGPFLLSQGITSIRDMGTVPADLLARKARIDAGTLLGPRITPLLLIDGPGPQSNFVAVVVRTPDEATAAVRRAKAQGYAGVKIYGSLDPALIAPIAAEAHRLGLRVQGHLPRTVRPLDAVRAGYDEITHINFVLMQAMPDAVVDDTDGPRQRHYGPMRQAPGVDLRAPAMQAYLDELVRRRTTVDPTLAVFERLWATEPGTMAPAYAPFAGRLPPLFERGLLGGGLAALPDLDRTRMRAAFGKLVELVGELHRRGVPILAGSDGYGLEVVRELELYVAAGMTPAQALAAATITPARTLGLDGETGSLAVGKLAELVLVDGDPGRRIGDLRRVELVMRDGRLMTGEHLRAAAGLTGAPS
jgi:imidazolonepropionase-like amidohydrolase